MAALFCHFLELINIYVVSLHSILLHGLELISFSKIPGKMCCHRNTFCRFLRRKNIFVGSLYSKPLLGIELITFGAEYLANTFSISILWI